MNGILVYQNGGRSGSDGRISSIAILTSVGVDVPGTEEVVTMMAERGVEKVSGRRVGKEDCEEFNSGQREIEVCNE